MKKAFLAILCAVLLSPLIANAWQMQSSPFNFPTAVLYRGSAAPSLFQLKSVFNSPGGVILFQYSLPAKTKLAKLNIYNVAGAQIESFDLLAGGKEVRWSFAKNKIATGVYFASVKIGAIEKTTQISIVK
jgi:hypothetical protein